MSAWSAGLLVVCVAFVLAGCETTKEKSARLATQAKDAVQETGQTIGSANADVTVTDTATVQDENGTAVVVTVRNSSREPQLAVPILVDVAGKDGASAYKNDAPGLDPSLTTIPVLGPGEELSWVNDQVTAPGPVAAVKATLGTPKADVKGSPARLRVAGAKLAVDETSGIEATGTVTNTTSVDQKLALLYVVARKGKRIIAAGRAVIPRINAGKKVVFHAFFIGDPTGGDLEVTAPVIAP